MIHENMNTVYCAERPSSLDIFSGTTSHRTVMLYCGDHGHPRAVKLKCSKRSCQECRPRTYWKLYRGWLRLSQGMANPKLLTVTIKNTPDIGRGDIKRVRAQFIRLMRRKKYRRWVLGGFYVIELVNKGRGWNLHIHALIDTLPGSHGFMPQQMISLDWKSITGTSFIVDIRVAGNAKGALKYILKYLIKPPMLSGQEDIYNEVMKGFRLIQTFGDLYGSKPDRPPRLACEYCGCNWWITEFEIFQMKKRPFVVLNSEDFVFETE